MNFYPTTVETWAARRSSGSPTSTPNTAVRLAGNTLHFNVNVDNFFNVSTATTYWPLRTLTNLTVTQDQIMAKDSELETSAMCPTPASGWSTLFYPPITARLGVRYSF